MNPINIPNSPSMGNARRGLERQSFYRWRNLDRTRFGAFARPMQRTAAVTPTFDQSTAVNLGGVIGFAEPINPEGLSRAGFPRGGSFGHEHEQQCLYAGERAAHRFY